VRAERDVDLVPVAWTFRAYQGDPFDVRIVLTIAGQPVDTTSWTWAADIDSGAGALVSFECFAQPDGVQLYLRGPETARLPSRKCRFDVVGRNPDAGEGRTVLRGSIIASARVTPPLFTRVSA
jgi:hypothetical protein